MKVCLVVATIGRREELVRLFDSLKNQKFKNFHVIVVDQNPEGFLADILEKYARSLSIEVVHLGVSALSVEAECPETGVPSQPQGVSHARNVGLERSSGDILAFPDDDCWYIPETLERVVHLFNDLPSMGGLLVGWNESGLGGHKDDLKPVGIHSAFNRAGTCVQFYRSSAIQDIRFDQKLGPGTGLPYGCGEDTDFLLFALKKGVAVKRTAEILVRHAEPDVSSPNLLPKLDAYARGRMYLLDKHGFPLGIKIAHIAYPLLRLPLEGPKFWAYRWAMFRGRLQAWLEN